MRLIVGGGEGLTLPVVVAAVVVLVVAIVAVVVVAMHYACKSIAASPGSDSPARAKQRFAISPSDAGEEVGGDKRSKWDECSSG